MPLLDPAPYACPWYLRNHHLHTVWPTFFRPARRLDYRRERLELEDGDFLDIDWSRVDAPRAVILMHGLVSCSEAPYMRGMARALNRAGWDTVGVNLRGGSGVPNRQFRSYHSGSSDDLSRVVEHVRAESEYSVLAIVGFSLGGNITLKYAGERTVPDEVKVVAAVSVPCDLAGSAGKLALPVNALYMKRFLYLMRKRLGEKQHLAPPDFDWEKVRAARNFWDYDNAVTAPLFGYRDAQDYYDQCASIHFIEQIEIPALLLSAADDPFLCDGCYPRDRARQSPSFHLEVPTRGGHLGFVQHGHHNTYWHEARVAAFLERAVSRSNNTRKTVPSHV